MKENSTLKSQQDYRIADNADLPIYHYRENILDAIGNNKITLINFPDGSEKVCHILIYFVFCIFFYQLFNY